MPSCYDLTEKEIAELNRIRSIAHSIAPDPCVIEKENSEAFSQMNVDMHVLKSNIIQRLKLTCDVDDIVPGDAVVFIYKKCELD